VTAAILGVRHHARDDAVAARPGESECVAVGDVDFLRERFAQQASRAEETRAHRRLRDAERNGGFLDGELLQRAQHEHGPERVGQFVDLRLEQPASLCAPRGVFGLLRQGLVHVPLHGFAVLSCFAAQLDDFSPAAALAQAGDGLVRDDADQPRGQLRVAAEGAHPPVREQIGFLHRVLGLGVVPQDAACRAVDHLVVPAHQQLERALVAGSDSLRQFQVGQLAVSDCGCCGLHMRLLLLFYAVAIG